MMPAISASGTVVADGARAQARVRREVVRRAAHLGCCFAERRARSTAIQIHADTHGHACDIVQSIHRCSGQAAARGLSPTD
eukprot:scaffold143248_cov139-Phaeocystis_antarctica.AAC.1